MTESGDAGSAAMGLAPELAQDGNLLVPMAGTFKFDDAPAAFAALTGPYPSGKLALVSER